MILTFSSTFVLAKLPAITSLSSAFKHLPVAILEILNGVYCILYKRAIVSKQDFDQVVGQSLFSYD
jgi:hypothetical protein